MSSPTIWSSQTFRTLYTVGFWSINIPHLFYLALRNSFAPIRAVPQWGYQLNMGVAILRALFRYIAVNRYQQPRQMVPGKTTDRFVLIAPPNSILFRGVLRAPAAATEPEPVGAVWYPALVPDAAPGTPTTARRRVIVYAAGGALVTGWDAEENAKNISALARTDHFDQTTHVLYAHTLSPPPSKTCLPHKFTWCASACLRGTSSSWGTRQEPTSHKQGSAVAFSPWVEVTAEAVQKYSRSVASRYDMLDVPLLEWGIDAYRPQGKVLTQEEEAYISPLHHPFPLKTRLYVDAGSLDGVYESISLFAKQMTDVAGNQVRFHTTENMPHDYFPTYPLLGTKEEACAALRDARDFLSG
ncbi:hypothetical protein PG984_012152 [Apiospora sp. TS-2023a]